MRIGADAIRDVYTGAVANRYDDQRSWEPKWQAENAAVEKWLGIIGPGALALDIPVGTGRFLAAYRRHGMTAVGMDVSVDMLALARCKDADAELRVGNILAIDMPDASVDVAIAVRIMNWLKVDEMRVALAELARVTRQWIVTSGGRSIERHAMVRASPGFVLFDEVPIESNIRGDYSLALLRRAA